MTLAFASRSAARKLGIIITLLLLPALFFGGAFVRQSLHDLASLERKFRGVELAELVFPILDSENAGDLEKDMPKIRALEASLGMDDTSGIVAHFKMKSSSGPTIGEVRDAHDHEEGQAQGYIADVAVISGLTLEDDAESYHLANMLLITLPVVWTDAISFERLARAVTPDLSTRNKLSQITGSLYGTYNRQADSLKRAVGATKQPEKYTLITAVAERLNENIGVLSALVTGPDVVPNQNQMLGLTSGMRRLSHAMVGPAFGTLKANLVSRKQLLNRMLYSVFTFGFVAAIIAVYMAARMISTTFKKLDAVEEAHRLSVAMREETDRVNGEVADLNRTLSDSLKKLQDAQGELLSKSKMEQLGQLTATVAHEIRNPLGTVRTSAFLIARKIDGKEVGIEKQLERINKGVDRCDNIITQLLDFSRTKQIRTQPSKFDDWLEGVVRDESEALHRDITIECHLGLGELEICFDQGGMRRAIINLMNNAAEAMVGKGETTNVPVGLRPVIHIETQKTDGQIEITVEDNGPGMTAEILSKIREPLFTTKNFGTGLGIPAVEQIVKQHGGELSIQSEVGQGAKFTISIPISQSARHAA